VSPRHSAPPDPILAGFGGRMHGEWVVERARDRKATEGKERNGRKGREREKRGLNRNEGPGVCVTGYRGIDRHRYSCR